MSAAFVKENYVQDLNEVGPSFGALLLYLRRKNGGVPILETKNYYSQKYKRDVFEMSDGLTYAKNDANKWYIIPDN
jgi:hypothetical protein